MINQNNPLQPMGAVTADLQMASYRQRYTALTQSLNDQAPSMPEVANPFLPQTGNVQKQQDSRRAQLEQFLAPIDRPDPERSIDYHAKRMANLQHHIDNHPVMKKMGAQMTGVMTDLLQAYQQGMPLDQVKDLFADWADTNLEPEIDAHTSGSDSIHLLSDIKTTPKLLGGVNV